ncbi:MAG: hypothetical protein JJU28_06895 [Cyclobacteriaceae bacterium]|nr:hypothetical protein [Cyclobacteriaceae bacterium]
MEVKDLLVTPILLLLVYAGMYISRPAFTNKDTRKYFIPGFTLKVLGAIMVGVIYQFYYKGGDTFTYFTNGSRHIWEAFLNDPATGVKLIFAGKEYDPETYMYARRIFTYGDIPSYFVVRVSAVFGLMTFHTYSAVAVLFALMSFTGVWAIYSVFYKIKPHMHFELAVACLFIPSVFFWGSGILKDSLTLGAVGWMTWGIYRIFVEKKNVVLSVILVLAGFYIVYIVKIYILLCFLPAAMLWISMQYLKSIRNQVFRWAIAPMILIIAAGGGYYAVIKVGEENARYNIESIASTAEATARWIHFVSERDGGSGYTLGDYDYSPAGVLRKTPAAIWVSLYRPYLWEVKNPVMLMSALESVTFLLFTLWILFRGGHRYVTNVFSDPLAAFCLVFAISFAFAVGLTTYNFGSLVRYKIPMLPFFATALFILNYKVKSSRNSSFTASTV